MKTKTVFIASIVTVLALLTGYSFANGFGPMYGGKMSRGAGMDYIYQELNITEDQQAQIQVIMQDFRNEMHATMTGRTEPPTDEERDAHHALLKDRLASALSADQIDGLDKYMAAHNQQRGFGHMGKGQRGNCDSQGYGQMNGAMNGSMNGHMNGQMDGHMNGAGQWN